MSYYRYLLEIMKAVEDHSVGRPIENPDELREKCKILLGEEPTEPDPRKLLEILGPEKPQPEMTNIARSVKDWFRPISPPIDELPYDVSSDLLRAKTFSRLSPIAVLGLLVGAGAASYILKDQPNAFIINVWLLVYLTMGIARIIWSAYVKRTDLSAVQGAFHSKMITIIAASFGLAWGVLLLLSGDLDFGPKTLGLMLVSLGMLSGGVTVYYVKPAAGAIFTTLLGVPLIWVCYKFMPELGILAALYVGWILAALRAHEGQFTETLLAMTALHEQKENLEVGLRGASSAARQWIWVCDENLRLQDCESGLAAAFGRKVEACNGSRLIELISGHTQDFDQNAQIEAVGMQLQLHKSFKNIKIVVDAEREVKRWVLSGVARSNRDGSFAGYKGVIRAIDTAEATDNIREIDENTKLPTYSWLQPHVEDALSAAQLTRGHCALVVVTLKNAIDFSANGIRSFSATLSDIADVLRFSIPGNIVAYAGRDRFIILLRNIEDKDEVKKMLESLRADLCGVFAESVIKPEFAMGVALGPTNNETVSLFRENAETALSGAMEDRFDAIHFYQPRNRKLVSVEAVVAAILPAMEEQTIRLRYDAVFDVAKRTATMLRIKLCWDHFRLGIIPQDTVLSVISDPDLRRSFSDYVVHILLRSALSTANGAAVALPSAFLDLSDNDLISKLRTASTMTSSQPSSINIIISAEEASMPVIALLAASGFRIGMDIVADEPLNDVSKHVSSVWVVSNGRPPEVGNVDLSALNIENIIAIDASELGQHGVYEKHGYTAISGMSSTCDMSADEASFFTSLADQSKNSRVLRAG